LELDTLTEPELREDTVPERESLPLRVSLGDADAEVQPVAVAVGDPLPEAVSDGWELPEGSGLTLPDSVDAAVKVTETVVDWLREVEEDADVVAVAVGVAEVQPVVVGESETRSLGEWEDDTHAELLLE
jgi:hypothetical protein